METLWIMILGAVQGATEFLPVSSSGHLAAGQMALASAEGGLDLSAQPLTLEILLHLATLLAVLVFYRKDVMRAVSGGLSALGALVRGGFVETIEGDAGANLALCIVVGTLPTAIIGLALEQPAGFISRSPLALGLTFFGCAALLLATRWWTETRRRLTWKTALLIGVVQGLAVLPGISRSGATIAVALAIGLDREEAARFSFLLSIPAIAGAAVMELDPAAMAGDGLMTSYLLGGLVAFGVGLGALFALVRIVRGGRLWLFAPYVALAGLVTIFVIG